MRDLNREYARALCCVGPQPRFCEIAFRAGSKGDMSERMAENMLQRLSEDVSERMAEDLSERMSEDRSERMFKQMSNRMSEDM